MTALVEVRELQKYFGEHHVLKGINLEVESGERIAIIGGSGSGKSTFLRCLNFMEIPTSGRIFLDGELVGSVSNHRRSGEQMVYRERDLCQVRERLGMVFQQFNLFPHMTVLENVMEGLVTVKKLPRKLGKDKALEMLEIVGLSEKINVHPVRLSGGQQQRVAIARALAMEPEILLFDEPTSSLDPELVGEVLAVIRKLADLGTTMLLVTHELGFAYHFATKVIFLADGSFYEEGSPEEVLKNPKKERTKAFIKRFSEFAF